MGELKFNAKACCLTLKKNAPVFRIEFEALGQVVSAVSLEPDATKYS